MKKIKNEKISYKILILAFIVGSLAACNHHENPLLKADIESLQKGYQALTENDRSCIDGITARSKNSVYKEPANLHRECQTHYPIIAHTFSQVLHQAITIDDLDVPDFWLSFFEKNTRRIESLAE